MAIQRNRPVNVAERVAKRRDRQSAAAETAWRRERFRLPRTEARANARDNSARKAFLIVVARAVLDQLLGRGAGSPRGVLDALARAAGEAAAREQPPRG